MITVLRNTWQNTTPSIPLKFYNLPKLKKKENFPLRPVLVDFTNSPFYVFSIFMTGIFNGSRNDAINIQSSDILRQELKSINLQEDDIFASFDEVAMYMLGSVVEIAHWVEKSTRTRCGFSKTNRTRNAYFGYLRK